MLQTQVTFYDGIHAKPYVARISPLDGQSLQIQYGEGTGQLRRYHYQQMTFIGAVGKLVTVIELDDDARIEFSDEPPEWLQLKSRKTENTIEKIERSPLLILCSLILVVGFVFGLVKWGVPTAAYTIAQQLPEDILQTVGNEAEIQVMNMTKVSQLSPQRQQQILKDYQHYIADGKNFNLKFRQGGQLGANALAIPNGTIIVTDELVYLTQNDQELWGVLAHEQAHLLQRHSLQQALSTLGISVIWISITGDMSDLASALPFLLLSANYSREFERQADGYALQLMKENQISTLHFARFIERLGEDDDTSLPSLDYLSSHPATVERAQRARQYAP